MACYSPLTAWRSRTLKTNGKSEIVFKYPYHPDYEEIHLPCGQCIGCRLERSRQWAIRCVHENQMHDDSMFLTLTYDDDNLPDPYLIRHKKTGEMVKTGNLRKSDFQKFMKRLRRSIPDVRIKFFHCGEYGEQSRRPHYHALIFGYSFDDLSLFNVRGETKIYTSKTLNRLWPFGFSTVGSVTFESAAYVARYITKKVTGEKADYHYISTTDADTGEVSHILPEYITMSLNPAIGKEWYDTYKDDVYRAGDFVVLRNIKMRSPRYYDKLYESDFPDDFKIIKDQRSVSALEHSDNNTPERLAVREKVQLAKMKQLHRGLENEC